MHIKSVSKFQQDSENKNEVVKGGDGMLSENWLGVLTQWMVPHPAGTVPRGVPLILFGVCIGIWTQFWLGSVLGSEPNPVWVLYWDLDPILFGVSCLTGEGSWGGSAFSPRKKGQDERNGQTCAMRASDWKISSQKGLENMGTDYPGKWWRHHPWKS